jgi:hypothetical protein
MPVPYHDFVSTLIVPDGATSGPWEPPINDRQYVEFTRCGGQGYTRDGFFHFFGPDGPPEHSLSLWNERGIWRGRFLADLAWLAVAEDAFGYQFCMRLDGRRPVVKVVSLWSGAFTLVGNTFEGFLNDVVKRPDGWSSLKARYCEICANEAMTFRPLHHLSPKIPPLLEAAGSDDSMAFEWVNSTVNASFLAQVYDQVRHLPPGAQVQSVQTKMRKPG